MSLEPVIEMSNHSDDSRRKSSVFKFEGQGYLLIAVSLISGLFLFLGFAIETGRNGPASSGELIVIGGFLLFFFMGILILRQQSAIVIDEQGISRCLWGWKWQTIRWDNIRVIKVSPYFHPVVKKMVRVFRIYPSVPPRFRFFPAGGMAFVGLAVKMSELIEIMNDYVARHKIKIETLENGISTSVSHL